MRLLSPTLSIDGEATAGLIEKAILTLPGKDDPFLILESNEQTYVQLLWVGSGYELEYQQGSIDEHYLSINNLDAKMATAALIGYLKGEQSWNVGIDFKPKDIRGSSGRLGYALGRLFGKVFRAK